MKLSFFGAARCVTGSCHMLDTPDGKVLIDCGMRQGRDAKGEYGEDRFPFDPKEISYALLTHAHIDHSGLMPLLVKRGYTGPILCTDATAQLAGIMLPDSAHIQEQEAQWQSRKNERAGKKPVEPLYTMADVEQTMKLLRGAAYNERIRLSSHVDVRFKDVGHLLGSAAIEVWVQEGGRVVKTVFSGDIGRDDRPILNDPQDVDSADYLVMESTYGDREHTLSTDADKEAELCAVIQAAMRRGGNLVIPSFAVGRTQELLYYIKRILRKGLAPGLESIPVWVDSPLGIQATKVYERCALGYYDTEAMELARDGSPFDFPTLHIAQSSDESKFINIDTAQKIIISASGMCDAGRIRHHLKHNLYRADSTVMFAGYQAEGTLGRILCDGVRKVKLFGEDVRVNADIVQTDGFSGHAGRSELLEWAGAMSPKPRRVFLVHGEEKSLESLSAAMEELGYTVEIPSLNDEVALSTLPQESAGRPASVTVSAPRGVRMPAAAPLSSTAPEYEGNEQLKRLAAVVLHSAQRRSPDMELYRTVLEADLKTLADKWEALIGKTGEAES